MLPHRRLDITPQHIEFCDAGGVGRGIPLPDAQHARILEQLLDLHGHVQCVCMCTCMCMCMCMCTCMCMCMCGGATLAALKPSSRCGAYDSTKEWPHENSHPRFIWYASTSVTCPPSSLRMTRWKPGSLPPRLVRVRVRVRARVRVRVRVRVVATTPAHADGSETVAGGASRVEVLLIEVARELRHHGARPSFVNERAHLEAVLGARLRGVPQPVAVAHGAAMHLGARTDDAHVRGEQEARGADRGLASSAEDGRQPGELRLPHLALTLRRRPVVGVEADGAQAARVDGPPEEAAQVPRRLLGAREPAAIE